MLSGPVPGREPVQKRHPDACRRPGPPKFTCLPAGISAPVPQLRRRTARFVVRGTTNGGWHAAENIASPAVTYQVLLNGIQAARHI